MGDDIQRYRDNLQDELNGSALYTALADAETDPVRKDLFLQLAQAEADGRRYRVAGDIRVELEKLVPQGVVVEAVEVIDGQVNLRYRAPKDDPETLLRRVRERFPGGLGPQQVAQHAVEPSGANVVFHEVK